MKKHLFWFQIAIAILSIFFSGWIFVRLYRAQDALTLGLLYTLAWLLNVGSNNKKKLSL